MNTDNITVPEVQRALILQGGGALAAYQVGALKELINDLKKKIGYKEGLLFDIVAGTSMGAFNAAVLVGNVVNRNKTWEDAAEELDNFWTKENSLSSKVEFSKWWKADGNIQNMAYASDEALRKYYSVKEYLIHGTPRVCTPPLITKLDTKFGDQKDNLWYHHSNKPLEDTITKYSKKHDSKELRIVTSIEKHQPRLLVVSVDVAKGIPVTFDSYHKEGEEPNNSLYYGDGITIDHIMASGTIPEFYDFRVIGGSQFCDGGLISNTPFRELLQAHQEYWLKVIKDKDNGKIPSLEIYIINNHPSKGSPIDDYDHDGVKDRINDITFYDRNSVYDENVFNTYTDYVKIIHKLKHLAKSYIDETRFDNFKNDIENYLKSTCAKSKSSIGEHRTCKEVLDSMITLAKVIRIENTGYDDSISGKGADFTSESIEALIKKGQNDARKCLA